jgi:hypothetical protein
MSPRVVYVFTISQKNVRRLFIAAKVRKTYTAHWDCRGSSRVEMRRDSYTLKRVFMYDNLVKYRG